MFHNLLVVLLILSSGLFLNSPQAQSYPIKSGIIEYVLTGRSYGTENISFDKYGKLIIVSKTLSFLVDGEVRNENLIVIIKNDSIFEFNSKLKTYTISSVFENSYHASNHLVNQELLLAMGFFHTGKEIVAKHECDKYTSTDGTLWVWKGIVLRSSLTVMGAEVGTKAIKVICNAHIPIAKFNNPIGYHLEKK